jgi:hypothetical protein
VSRQHVGLAALKKHHVRCPPSPDQPCLVKFTVDNDMGVRVRRQAQLALADEAANHRDSR